MVEARRQCHDAYSHINSFVILRVLISDTGAEKKSTSSTDWSVSKQVLRRHKVTKCTYMQNRNWKNEKSPNIHKMLPTMEKREIIL